MTDDRTEAARRAMQVSGEQAEHELGAMLEGVNEAIADLDQLAAGPSPIDVARATGRREGLEEAVERIEALRPKEIESPLYRLGMSMAVETLRGMLRKSAGEYETEPAE